MKIRPKTFKLLKELLLEKGGVFYIDDEILDFKYNEENKKFETEHFEIERTDMKLWLEYDDWHIKV